MKSRHSLLLSAVIAAFIFPVAAHAQNAQKATAETVNRGGELGMVEKNPPKSTKTRKEVKKELDVAHKDGSHEMGNDASTLKPVPTTSNKSRQDVKKEVANMTPEEKKKLKESSLGGK